MAPTTRSQTPSTTNDAKARAAKRSLTEQQAKQQNKQAKRKPVNRKKKGELNDDKVAHESDLTIISNDDMGNILEDFKAKEFLHAGTALLVTPIMERLFGQLQEAVGKKRPYDSLLKGPSGVGKTTTLLYIGHMARKEGYLVFPIQAANFVDQTVPMSSLIKQFLTSWKDAVGEEILKQVPVAPLADKSNSTMWDLVNQDMRDEKVVMTVFNKLIEELKTCKSKPVVFLVDQCNAFHADPQTIRLFSDSNKETISYDENPVGCLFWEWNKFEMSYGGIFLGYSAAFQLMPTARDGNSSLFCRMDPMDSQQFKKFIAFLVQQNRLPEKCQAATHLEDFFKLCGGVPREARKFGDNLFGVDFRLNPKTTNYQQWKDVYLTDRIISYKTRIHRLLNKEKLGSKLMENSVCFAASLFMSQEMMSAPDIWIASGLIVATKTGLQKLCCPAAERAILAVFEDRGIVKQSIEIFSSEESIRWRSFELAVVYLFRKCNGMQITFHYTDLKGENKRTLMVIAGSIQHGGSIRPAEKSIPRGTLYVCARNTPVVDCFIHDACGKQVLIQVSESCYRKHSSKYDPNDENIRVYSASAMDPLPGAELQYIYLTPNPSKMTSSNDFRDDVKLVSGDAMKKLFLGLFDDYKTPPGQESESESDSEPQAS